MPMPGAYWLAPCSSAASAAAITDGGPSTSGKPWPRLIARVRTASADISLNTVGGMWARRRDNRASVMATKIASPRPRCRRTGSGRAGQPGLPQVEVGRLTHGERIDLGHRLADRLRRLLLLGGPGLGLAGEVDRHRPAVAVVHCAEAAQ